MRGKIPKDNRKLPPNVNDWPTLYFNEKGIIEQVVYTENFPPPSTKIYMADTPEDLSPTIMGRGIAPWDLRTPPSDANDLPHLILDRQTGEVLTVVYGENFGPPNDKEVINPMYRYKRANEADEDMGVSMSHAH